MANKILVVSDTHGDESWLELIKKNNYDSIIHAGDHLLGKSINEITPHYVDGNNDWGSKSINELVINKQKVVIVHGDEFKVNSLNCDNAPQKFEYLINKFNPNIIIFGHTHIPFMHKDQNNVIYLNPGSMSYSRHDGRKYYMEITFNNAGEIDIELINYS